MNHNFFAKLLSSLLAATLVAGSWILLPGVSLADSSLFNVSRVSIDSSNTVEANDESNYASISADGRYVAFISEANNLVAGDTNNSNDIFRKDLQTGDIVRVSVDSSGAQANNDSDDEPAISGDGRYVAFESLASNLVPSDTNDVTDIFRKDLQTGDIVRVSVDSSGVEADAGNGDPSITTDGRYVAFKSLAGNLVEGEGEVNYIDVFRKDLQTGDIIRVSVDSSGAEANGGSDETSISADGRYVAFRSFATNLVSGDTTAGYDIFRKDLQTGDIARASINSSNAEANDWSHMPSISADGRYVAFESAATNLVSGDTNIVRDIFRKDLQTNDIVRVSVDFLNNQATGSSYESSISADGRYVAFESAAGNLVSGDTDTNSSSDISSSDIFRKDLQTAEIVRFSVDASGAEANNTSYWPSISADGRYIAFESDASNLISGDTNSSMDIFRVRLESEPDPLVPTIPDSAQTPTTTPAPAQTPASPVQNNPEKKILSTTLTIKTSKNVLTVGNSIILSGLLKGSDGKGLSGKKITIKIAKRKIGKAVTDAQGVFKLKVKPKYITKFKKASYYRAIFKGDSSYGFSIARSKKIFVKEK